MDKPSQDQNESETPHSTVLNPPQAEGGGTENLATGLLLHTIRRTIREHLFKVIECTDALLKLLIGFQNSDTSLPILTKVSEISKNPLASDPLPTTGGHDKPNDSGGPSAANTGSQLDSPEDAEPPEISRTVVAKQGGSVVNSEKRYFRLSESDYDSVETNDRGAAIELRKDVNTIKSPSNNLQLGNKALENEIIDHVTSEKIIIRSPQLLKVIKSKIYWPSSAFYHGQKSLSLDSPYRSIGVYRGILGKTLEDFMAYLDRIDNGGETFANLSDTLALPDLPLSESDLRLAVRHLDLFLREVDKVQGNGAQLEEDRHSRSMATFDMLWKLFKPGTVVYTEQDDARLACRVKLLVWSHGSFSKAGPDEPYQKVEVVVWYLDHNGSSIDRRVQSVDISRYHGEKSILDLPVYPQTSLPDWEKDRAARIERGRKFIRSIKSGYSYCDYDGEVSIDPKNPYNRQNHQRYCGRVLVDPEQHFREHGASKGSQWLDESDVQENVTGANLRRFIKLNPKANIPNDGQDDVPSAFGDDQLLLLPEWIRGFTMGTHGERKWVWLHVDGIRDYEPDEDLVNTIALDDDNIRLLKAMTYEPHNGDKLWSPEVIKNKSTGRVIILHGYPGLGKTYTAECLSEWSNRPLLRLTCAELGLEPERMESRLGSYLKRAERWKAMVLMDEADVYMRKRFGHTTRTETGVVSVFLRALEYFSGIIILTTNMIHEIDKAILNRALLIVKYKTLSRNDIAKVTENCLQRFRELPGVHIRGDAELVLRETLRGDTPKSAETRRENENMASPIAQYEYDGREVVQVLTLAVRLATFDHNDSKKASGVCNVAKKHVEEAIRIIQGHRVHREMEPALSKSEGYEIDRMG